MELTGRIRSVLWATLNLPVALFIPPFGLAFSLTEFLRATF